jgi:hypothetical protein
LHGIPRRQRVEYGYLAISGRFEFEQLSRGD